MAPAYRALPSTDRLLRQAPVRGLIGRFTRDAVLYLTRQVLDDARKQIQREDVPTPIEVLAAEVERRALREWAPAPQRVINATGVVLNTNLGRAPLSRDALDAMARVGGYSGLEIDLQSGIRGSRHEHVGKLLSTLSEGRSSHVTSNAAGAVLLALATVARGKEVIVSRGQAVEIGGGFRIPSVLRQSGARLVEVGTTNRTRLEDYEEAISPRTAAILHVHTSNFRVVGFTESVSLSDLADLARRRQLILLDDNGSGALLDTAMYGLAHEPTPVESLHAGAAIVVFSGDKLLGGPQAGIVLGEGTLIDRIAKHPLARAVRPDKTVLAALQATLLAYIRGDAAATVPIWQMISVSPGELTLRVQTWAKQLRTWGVDVDTQPGESTVGGGSLPGETLPTTLAVLPRGISARDLRRCDVPVIARTIRNRVALDPRTVPAHEDEELLTSLRSAAHGAEKTMVDSAT